MAHRTTPLRANDILPTLQPNTTARRLQRHLSGSRHLAFIEPCSVGVGDEQDVVAPVLASAAKQSKGKRPGPSPWVASRRSQGRWVNPRAKKPARKRGPPRRVGRRPVPSHDAVHHVVAHHHMAMPHHHVVVHGRAHYRVTVTAYQTTADPDAAHINLTAPRPSCPASAGRRPGRAASRRYGRGARRCGPSCGAARRTRRAAPSSGWRRPSPTRRR